MKLAALNSIKNINPEANIWNRTKIEASVKA